jgi:hypothetical protein
MTVPIGVESWIWYSFAMLVVGIRLYDKNSAPEIPTGDLPYAEFLDMFILNLSKSCKSKTIL